MVYKRRIVRKKRVVRKPRRLFRRRPIRRAANVAGVSETIPFTVRNVVVGPTTAIPTYTPTANANVWSMVDTTLASFQRAVTVAQSYQYFKLKYFELKILPGQDTFTPGSSSAKPYFYYQVDKGNTLPISLSQNQMRQMGCKPIVLDEKPIVIRWRPAVSLSTEISTSSGTTSAQMYRTTPWLNCDENPMNGAYQPSSVVHNGLKLFAENDGGSLTFRGTLTAHFAFKKPAVLESGV